MYERGGRGGGDCEAEMAAMFQQKRIKRLERAVSACSKERTELLMASRVQSKVHKSLRRN